MENLTRQTVWSWHQRGSKLPQSLVWTFWRLRQSSSLHVKKSLQGRRLPRPALALSSSQPELPGLIRYFLEGQCRVFPPSCPLIQRCPAEATLPCTEAGSRRSKKSRPCLSNTGIDHFMHKRYCSLGISKLGYQSESLHVLVENTETWTSSQS